MFCIALAFTEPIVMNDTFFNVDVMPRKGVNEDTGTNGDMVSNTQDDCCMKTPMDACLNGFLSAFFPCFQLYKRPAVCPTMSFDTYVRDILRGFEEIPIEESMECVLSVKEQLVEKLCKAL